MKMLKKCFEILLVYHWLCEILSVLLGILTYYFINKNINQDILLTLSTITTTSFSFLFTAMIFMTNTLLNTKFSSIRNKDSRAMKEFICIFCSAIVAQLILFLFSIIVYTNPHCTHVWYVVLLFRIIEYYALFSLIRCVMFTVTLMHNVLTSSDEK